MAFGGLSDCFSLAPRAGLPGVSSANGLGRQTCVRGGFDPQRLSGLLSNHQRATSSSSAARTAQTVASPKAPGEGAEKLEINPMNQRLQMRLDIWSAHRGAVPRPGRGRRAGAPRSEAGKGVACTVV